MPHSFENLTAPIVLRHEHRLVFTRGTFAEHNHVLADLLTPREPGAAVRALVFWDAGLEPAFPGLRDRITRWFEARGDRVALAVPPIAVPGGEAVKNDFRQLERTWSAINVAGMCRHSYIIAIGGGALLDMVGFAAATAHRGIPLIRVPTTSLSQADAGVGVKNGINFFGKKNWLGAFVVPHAIVNDPAFLDGQPPQERRAGLIEAVKVALVRDAGFFGFIEARVEALARLEPEPFEAVIRESARQHVEHIATGGDPFERGSARPLDFGHWAAHKLEQMAGFRIGHGEAVALGMALDIVYARRSGLLPNAMAKRILDVLGRLGFPLSSPLLTGRGAAGCAELVQGLEEFREHMGGRLTIPLIRAPGERIDVHEMDSAQIQAAIDELAERHG